MRKIYLLSILILAFTFITSATTYTITTGGFSFSPDSVHAHIGDTIIFNVAFSTHPLQEVSSTTWAANGTTPLPGGFAATSGSTFMVVMTQAGTRYYVCTTHASIGMKGRIVVSPASGIEGVLPLITLPYPNPVRDLLHIVSSGSGNCRYTLTNILGQNILDKSAYSVDGMISIDVSAISEGNYILSVTNPEGAVTQSKVDIRR